MRGTGTGEGQAADGAARLISLIPDYPTAKDWRSYRWKLRLRTPQPQVSKAFA